MCSVLLCSILCLRRCHGSFMNSCPTFFTVLQQIPFYEGTMYSIILMWMTFGLLPFFFMYLGHTSLYFFRSECILSLELVSQRVYILSTRQQNVLLLFKLILSMGTLTGGLQENPIPGSSWYFRLFSVFQSGEHVVVFHCIFNLYFSD